MPPELLTMLTYRRPAGSRSEAKFINRYLRPLGVEEDEYGNLIKQVGTSPILWSSHTDTVHRQGGRQSVYVDQNGHAYQKGHNCLGADCTTGVWLMVEMIKADVPGLYIFHRDEENGGLGSYHIAERTPDLLKPIRAAIALDRFGTKSIITHQWGTRSCSDAFANSLALALDLPMAPDDGGTFTDTANYTDLVGECTNLSVGYYNQHQSRETQNLQFAETLLKALIAMDQSALVFSRKPGEVEPRVGRNWYKDYKPANDFQDWSPRRSTASLDALVKAVKACPEAAARILHDYGVASDEVYESELNDCEGHPYGGGLYA